MEVYLFYCSCYPLVKIPKCYLPISPIELCSTGVCLLQIAGNLAALDFQARCMAAKTPKIARVGCIIGGLFTFLIGIPFAYLGGITR